MKSVIQVVTFTRDVKRLIKRNKDLNKLYIIVDMLANNLSLPVKYRAHKLIGNYNNKLECHIEPDWLLIYEIIENSVILYRSGTHADLFK